MEPLTDFLISAVSSPWVYLVIFVAVVVDGVFPPVPSEIVVTVAAAIGVSTGAPNPIVIVALAALGAAVGDNIAYYMGRSIGTERTAWSRRPRVVAAFAAAERGLARRAASMLLVARYIPVGRIAVNMTAGATRFSYHRFWPLTVVAGACWAIYTVLIGVIAGSWASDQPVLGAVIGAAIALVVGIAIDRISALVSRRRAAAADAASQARLGYQTGVTRTALPEPAA